MFQIIDVPLQPHLREMPTYGTLPEWLGTGLQNRGQRFESARYLQNRAVKRRLLLIENA